MTKTQMKALTKAAHAAGDKAAREVVPAPMRVVQRANPLDDASVITKDYGVYSEGMCGFAWVSIKPGTSSFARWMKSTGAARADSYAGGVTLWVSGYGQSWTRKSAYASAYANVLREAGVTAYAGDRLD